MNENCSTFLNRRTIVAISVAIIAVIVAPLALADITFAEQLAVFQADWPEYVIRASYLIREEAVQQELKLLPGTRALLPDLCDKLESRLFALRHTGPGGIHPNMRGPYEDLRQGLAKAVTLLDAGRQQRLMQLTLQSITVTALARPEMAAEFDLTEQQKDAIQALNEDLLQKLYAPTETSARSRRLFHKEIERKIMQQLVGDQRRKWQQLLGEEFNLARIDKKPLKASELIDTGWWLNGGPTSLADLQGNVVLVHFYTYGCVNCINNYPWYKKWYAQYNGRGVRFLGIHTPETPGERNIDSVRAAAERNDLKFPILIDNDMQNWRAWGNDMWPSVYLIDKRGRARYWWYGELDWQDRNGQGFIQERIERLLAE
jgi:peroxiredoxin